MIKSSYDTTLDDLDRQILKELQEDGRLSSVELARRVGLSTSATHARIKRLEQDGYVDRYVALLNWEQAGYDMVCFVNVSLQMHQPDSVTAFKAAVQAMPEVLEAFHFTGDSTYYNMGVTYWNDILQYCKNDMAFNAIENVVTKEKRDYMATYFFAETLKYFYLLFGDHGTFNFDDYIFTTEAHTFRRDQFNKTEAAKRLGF